MKMKKKTALLHAKIAIFTGVFSVTLHLEAQTGQDPTAYMSPLPQQFLDYLATQPTSGKPGVALAAPANGPGKGLIPSPLDTSHMVGRTPEGLELNTSSSSQSNNIQISKSAAAAYPSSYDLRNYGYVTSIKDQAQCGDCWAFASMASLDSNILKSGGTGYDFSENHLNVRHGFDNAPCGGGNGDMAGAYQTRWGNGDGYASGLVYETDDPYTSTNATSVAGLKPRQHLQEFLILPNRANGSDNTNYKFALTNYGGIYIGLYADTGMESSRNSIAWNQANSALYAPNIVTQNHAVTIIGWDDNYAASNFSTPPAGNGAWLAKNQWNTWFGQSGYFWISYYDMNVGSARVFRPTTSATSMNISHEYDPFGHVGDVGYGSTTAWAANIFQAPTSNVSPAAITEILKATSIQTTDLNTSYTIKVYTNLTSSNPTSGTLSATLNGSFPFAGYHTIILPTPLNLTAGSNFSIVVKYTNSTYPRPIPVQFKINGYTSAAAQISAGRSFISSDGNSWFDYSTDNTYHSVVNIRAFGSKPSPYKPTQFDINADGNSDIFWINSTGSNLLWSMNGSAVQAMHSYIGTGGWSLLNSNSDLNGDGVSDLIWTNSTTGAVVVWLMGDSTNILAQASYGPYAGWTLQSANNDFNGDKKSDLMWVGASGAIWLWQMDGVKLTSSQILGPYAGWYIKSGNSDFNGDGNTDLVWTTPSGAVSINMMNGLSISSVQQFGPYAGWTLVNSNNDFNGDGKSDLVWSNTSGAAAVWTMNGGAVLSMNSFGPYTGWSVQDQVGDYDGDGHSDLIWKNQAGAAAVWLMSGTNLKSITSYGPFANWNLVDAKNDYNGDGINDLMWSNTNGAVTLWLMNGSGQLSSQQAYGPFADWTIKPN